MKQIKIPSIALLTFLIAAVVVFAPGCASGQAQDSTDATAENATGTDGVDQTPAGQAEPSNPQTAHAAPPATTPAPKPAPAAQAPVPPSPIHIPAGEIVTVRFTDALSSETAQAGETFEAEVAEPVMIDGRVVIPAGTAIRGTVREANPANRFGGKASLDLAFDSIVVAGKAVPISAEFYVEERGEKKKDAATIGGGAAGGALLGRILKGDSDGTKDGAMIGAVVGTAIAASTKGKPVEIPTGAPAQLRLLDTVIL